ncbi:SH3 domain-containing protein, partial [Couchioplanes caeruleus]
MLPTTTRRLLAPLLLIALGAGPAVVPEAANAAGVSATVKVGNTLRVRSAPSLTAKVVGTVKNNQRVSVICAITGQKVRGSVRTTTAWDRLSTGRYLSHAYVKTSRSIPRCATKPARVAPRKTKPATDKKYVVGTVRSLDGAVHLRASATTSAARRDSVVNGTKLNLVCRVAGTRVAGTVRTTNQWNRTAAGTYISHAYMYSGPLPVCAASRTPAPSVS